MKWIQILNCIGILFLLLACQSNEIDHMLPSSKELPDNLKIDINVEDVDKVSEAKIYTATFIELNPEHVANQLLQAPIVDEELYAFGLQYQTEGDAIQEYLTIYDGGAAFGEAGTVDGGLYYTKVIDSHALNYDYIISFDAGPPDLDAQLGQYRLNNKFETNVDLAFKPYVEAKQEIIQTLSAIGIEDVEMERVHALDVVTINDQYQRYVKGSGDQVDVTIQWTEAEEAYLFHFRQVLDDIPLNNLIWQEGIRDAKEVTETEIAALYHKDGLIRLSVTGFYQMIESTQAEKLIDQRQALQQLIDYYNTVLLTSETVIDAMELNYIGVVEGQHYHLIPVWIFQVVTSEQTEPTDLEPAQAYDAYSYHVVNAITGERIVEVGGETD